VGFQEVRVGQVPVRRHARIGKVEDSLDRHVRLRE
jgi:hypothetical protein